MCNTEKYLIEAYNKVYEQYTNILDKIHFKFPYNKHDLKIFKDHAYETGYFKTGEKAYQLDHVSGKSVMFYDKLGNLLYRYLNKTEEFFSNNKLVRKIKNGVEYRYDEQGKCVYSSDSSHLNIKDEGDELPIIYGDPNDRYDSETGKPYIGYTTGVKKAENYMREYHGLFFHGCFINAVKGLCDSIVRAKTEQNKQSICASTIRADQYYGDNGDLGLVGFGEFVELYDRDVYSSETQDYERVYEPDAAGRDYESPELHKSYNKPVHIQKGHFFDEGFVKLKNIDILVVIVPDKYYGYNDYESNKVEGEILKHTRFNVEYAIRILKQHYPHIKVISYKQFKKMHQGQDFLKYVYKVKEERTSKNLMQEPLHKYEENKLLFNTIIEEFITRLIYKDNNVHTKSSFIGCQPSTKY